MGRRVFLGCDGRTDKGFVFCVGASNMILDLALRQQSENYPQLMEYVERVARLFIKPRCEYNVIVNTVYKFFDLGYINDLQYKYITLFIQQHKACGLVLRIE